jgi:hypothetical protein
MTGRSVKSKLFYEGRLMGEFDSPVESSHNFICWHCGRVFARRICEQPWTWKVEEGACGKCGFEKQVHTSSLIFFQVGGELTDHIVRPVLLATQFLYEADIAIGPDRHESATAERIRDSYFFGSQHGADVRRHLESGGFSGPEHTWAEGPFDGRLGNR